MTKQILTVLGILFFSCAAVAQPAPVSAELNPIYHAALKAGCDMLILCNDFEASDQLLKTLQFEDTPDRQERVKRLMPKGEALQWDALVNSALYKRSKALIPTR